jgi:putative flippase GtrA
VVLKAHIQRVLRFGAVGLASNAVGYLIYLLITFLGAGPKTTMTVLYAIGATIGYFGNRRFTFGFRGDHLKAVLRYGIAHLAGFALNYALLFTLVDIYGYPHQLVQAAAIFIVAGFLLLAFTFFVFRQDRTQIRPKS